jgi:2-hydroxychromene-2-carboxylate isomerase
MQMPAAQPFNPLALLRLALACGEGGKINRHVAETVFRHVWRGGADAADAARVEALKGALQPKRDPSGDEVKNELKSNTDDAIARGLFGVPAMEVDGKLFWGFDALPMLRAYLEGDKWFDGPDWEAVERLPSAVARVKTQ